MTIPGSLLLKPELFPLKNQGRFYAIYTKTLLDKGRAFVNQVILATFAIELKRLILEICNPEIPFIQKDV